MSKFSCHQTGVFTHCTSVFFIALNGAMVLSHGLFAPTVLAQAVQEVVITGNPLSKALTTRGVSTLSGLSLLEKGQSTLGETLNQLPGVSSTYFGPNASRPIIRGLDGDRIRVLSWSRSVVLHDSFISMER